MEKNLITNGEMLMDKILNIAQVIAPILAAVVLGMVARRREIMTAQPAGDKQGDILFLDFFCCSSCQNIHASFCNSFKPA